MQNLGLSVYLTACATFLYLFMRPTPSTVRLKVKRERGTRDHRLRGNEKL